MKFEQQSNIGSSNESSNAQLLALLDAAVDAMIIIDHLGTIKIFNHAAEKIFGYSSIEIVGKNVSILMPEPYKNAHEQYVNNYVRTKQAKIIGIGREVKAQKSNGEIFPIELSVGEVKQLDPPQFVGIIRDITERVQTQTDLAESRERLSHVTRLSTMGEMAAGIAHEINQPLTAITSYSQACQNILSKGAGEASADPSDKLLSTLEKISQQTLRASEVVSRLRSFVKKGHSQRISVNLNNLINETIDLAKVDTRILDHGICLTLVDDPMPILFADEVQIQQVLFNLIRNAIDATHSEQGKPVHIRSRWIEDNQIEVSVSDKGKGVEKHDEPMLFNPFFTTKATGMGMGLSISQTIIEVHGGKLEYFKATPKGSTFAFTLPATPTTKSN